MTKLIYLVPLIVLLAVLAAYVTARGQTLTCPGQVTVGPGSAPGTVALACATPAPTATPAPAAAPTPPPPATPVPIALPSATATPVTAPTPFLRGYVSEVPPAGSGYTFAANCGIKNVLAGTQYGCLPVVIAPTAKVTGSVSVGMYFRLWGSAVGPKVTATQIDFSASPFGGSPTPPPGTNWGT